MFFLSRNMRCGCSKIARSTANAVIDVQIAEKAYLDGVLFEESGRYGEAVERYLVAASRGHDGAQLNLGHILDNKLDPPRPAEARKWYKRAAARHYRPAAWNLSLHYKRRGRPKLYLRWLGNAAKLGDEDAIEALRRLGPSFRR
jgi:TPR repeat protein